MGLFLLGCQSTESTNTSTHTLNKNPILFLSPEGRELWQYMMLIEPKYPPERKDEAACTLVEFNVNADGTTSEVNVTKSFPNNAYDQSSISAVSKWKFVSGAKNGGEQPYKFYALLDFSSSDGTKVTEKCEG